MNRIIFPFVTPRVAACVALASLAFLPACSKSEKNQVSASAPKPAAPPSERGVALIAAIEKNNATIAVNELSPPTTHDSFWYQGQGLVPFMISNKTHGYIFDSWEEGVTPTAGTVVAFKGWLFLRGSGEALVVFARYQYKLERQTIYEAYAVKIPRSYDVEARTLPAKWEISGDELRVIPVGENPDPKYFSEQGAAVFNLSKWKTPEEREAERTTKANELRTVAIKGMNEVLTETMIDDLVSGVLSQNDAVSKMWKGTPVQKAILKQEREKIRPDVPELMDEAYNRYREEQRREKRGISEFADYWSGTRNFPQLYRALESRFASNLKAALSGEEK